MATTRKKKAAKKALPKPPSRYVLMPGGSRLRTTVKKALVNANASDALLKKLDRLAPYISIDSRRDLLENNSNFIRHLVPLAHEIINPRWVAYAGWNNTTGIPIASFMATLRVPVVPATKYGPAIFIFPGLQSERVIAQPILQYGITGMGGGAYWSVGSCLIASQTRPIVVSRLTRVAPGDILQAVINLDNFSGNQYQYSCYFDNYPNSVIRTGGIEELKYCCVTLESYNVNSRAGYPSQVLTSVGDIQLRDAHTTKIKPAWQVKPNHGSLGEHAVVRSSPVTDDNIDLYF